MSYLIVCGWGQDGRGPAVREEATEAEAIAAVARIKPENPEVFYVLNDGFSGKPLIVDAVNSTVSVDLSPGLAAAKSAKCAAVDALYSGQYGTCTHLTFTWNANDLSAGKIEAKHNHYKAAPPETITWADTSGTLRTLSWADFESLKNRIFEFHEATFANMKTLKTAISALGSVAAVEAYDITTGWPV